MMSPGAAGLKRPGRAVIREAAASVNGQRDRFARLSPANGPIICRSLPRHSRRASHEDRCRDACRSCALGDRRAAARARPERRGRRSPRTRRSSTGWRRAASRPSCMAATPISTISACSNTRSCSKCSSSIAPDDALGHPVDRCRLRQGARPGRDPEVVRFPDRDGAADGERDQARRRRHRPSPPRRRLPAGRSSPMSARRATSRRRTSPRSSPTASSARSSMRSSARTRPRTATSPRSSKPPAPSGSSAASASGRRSCT